jgi:type III restriction enzyme
MKFQLTGYQTDATSDAVSAIQEGFERYAKNSKLTAVALAAPTGAGKTVIATAAIEKLLYGDEFTDPNTNLTVLWVTDDPSLNQQTKRKMLLASSQIKPGQLVSVDASLDQRVLDAGRVYFCHIQQLGKGATNYIKTGNKRQYSLWDTIGTTIRERPTEFLLVIDEAHHGARLKAGGAKTITAQLMDGAGGNFPPSPVVLGISATPERFVEAISKAGQRTMEPVTVDPQAVRESGLLKDKLLIKHPAETQPGDSTLLELAVRDLKLMDELWAKYSSEEHEPHVVPALVIQVRAKVSDAELTATLDTLASAWSILDGKAIGHSFQEHSTLSLGARSVRYVAPQDIQDDPQLRVVLFKEALTTGWDCPRAEVMLSFRAAQDYTYIAQLIGRMVRTPLARRIATDDVLNTVALYLPHYDDEQVEEVIKGLQSDETNLTATIEVDSIVCGRNSKVPAPVWNVVAGLPTYTRPGKHHRNEVARLNALAALLVGNDLDPKAAETARNHIVGTLGVEAARLGSDLDDKVADFEQLEYQTQAFDFRTGEIEKQSASALVNARNIDDLFKRGRRALGDAAAKWYWDSLCDGGMDPDEAKIFVAALADDESVPKALETAAKQLVDTWRSKHNGAIAQLPDSKRALFFSIWQQSKAPEQVTMLMPSQITTSDDGAQWKLHLYANGKSTFPAKFTGWELEVLKQELEKPTLLGWYRNPTGGTAALAVPYVQSGVPRTVYPDFIFFHEMDGEIVVDIVDPHRPDAADTGPKWRGLADFATTHSGSFRRVAAVIQGPDKKLMSLDLKNPNVAEALERASNETDIRKIFATMGGTY